MILRLATCGNIVCTCATCSSRTRGAPGILPAEDEDGLEELGDGELDGVKKRKRMARPERRRRSASWGRVNSVGAMAWMMMRWESVVGEVEVWLDWR